MPTLSVELNGDAVHAIEAPDRFASTGSFAVVFENRGRSTHVHLNFDDDLAPVTSIGETNHYVDDESTRRVHISVADVAEPVRGKLKIVTGYGSTTEYVDVQIDPPSASATDAVSIDESFTKPPERPPDVPVTQQTTNALDRLIERGSMAAFVLAFIAVVAGIGVALTIESTLVSLAVGVLLIVTIGAVLLTVW